MPFLHYKTKILQLDIRFLEISLLYRYFYRYVAEMLKYRDPTGLGLGLKRLVWSNATATLSRAWLTGRS